MLQAPCTKRSHKIANRVEMCAIASVSHIIEAESVQLIQKQGPARWRKPAPVPSGWLKLTGQICLNLNFTLSAL